MEQNNYLQYMDTKIHQLSISSSHLNTILQIRNKLRQGDCRTHLVVQSEFGNLGPEWQFPFPWPSFQAAKPQN